MRKNINLKLNTNRKYIREPNPILIIPHLIALLFNHPNYCLNEINFDKIKSFLLFIIGVFGKEHNVIHNLLISMKQYIPKVINQKFMIDSI